MVDQIDQNTVEEITRRVVERLVREEGRIPDGRKLVPVGISVRHVHLCREHVDVLFGPGFELKPRNELYQPGQYASKNTVTLVGPRMRCMDQVRILTPLRSNTQVEIARTDAIYLGLDPPVRPSGNHEGTPGIIIVGPKGVIHLDRGVIRANRHIHLGVEDGQRWGIADNDSVKVRIVNKDKRTVFEDVQARVNPEFRAEFHLDTDDANATSVSNGDLVEIID